MEPGSFAKGLFGKRAARPLRLREPIEAREVILHDERTASCEGIHVVSDTPLCTLMKVMTDLGVPDGAVVIRDPARHQLGLFMSFHAAGAPKGRIA